MRLLFRPVLFALSAAILFAASPAFAQVQGPIAPKPGTPIQQAPPKAGIRVQVALVNAPVAVRNAKGELVLDLQQGDFHILDNGQRQSIEAFDLGGEPLSLVLVFETSSRIAPLLPSVEKSGIIFTQTVVGANGDAAVLGYNDSVDRLLPFTADHDQIEKAVSNLKTGTSGAKLYNALAEAVAMLRDRPTTRRRVIIVVGEPRDAGSEEKFGEVLRNAQLSNIVIYTVGLSTTAAELRAPDTGTVPPSATPPGTFGLPPIPGYPQTPGTEAQRQGEGGADLMAVVELLVKDITAKVKDNPLQIAAIATGGLYQATIREASIEKAVDAIGGELNSQYTLSYHPTDTQTAGYHVISVTVDKPGLKVRSRPGYYLEAQ